VFLNRKDREERKATNHPKKPQITQITQIDADGFVPMPLFSAWRGSGRPKTAGLRWIGTPNRMRAFVAVSRPSGLRFLSASLATSLSHSIAGRGTPPSLNKKEERQNRRALGTSAGEKTDIDESSLSEMAGFSPATGDFSTPVVLPREDAFNARVWLSPLCVSAPLRGWAEGWALRSLRFDNGRSEGSAIP
jgi:hypothetical protein